jgi:uncharacterized protein
MSPTHPVSGAQQPMSEETIQAVTKCFEAAASGDIQTFVACLSPDIVWTSTYPPHLPFSGEARGIEATAQLLMRMSEPFEVLGIERGRAVVQGDTAFFTGLERLRAKATGKLANNHFAIAATVKDGKIASVSVHPDTFAVAEALRP